MAEWNDATIRGRAEKECQRLVAKGGPASLLASTGRQFVLSIPLLEREKPVAMSAAFRQSARAEFAVRYLEELGATPTSENVALVEKHMNLDKRCKVQAAWKSRGSVADFLYISPEFPNTEGGGSGGGGANGGGASGGEEGPLRQAGSKAAGQDEVALDDSLVQSVLNRMQAKRARKIELQRPKAGQGRCGGSGGRASCKRVSAPRRTCLSRGMDKHVADTLAMLEHNFGPESARSSSSQRSSSSSSGGQGKGGKDDEDEAARSTELNLRLPNFAELRENFFQLDSLVARAAVEERQAGKREAVARAKRARAAAGARKNAAAQQEKRAMDDLFPREVQLFPYRVTASGGRKPATAASSSPPLRPSDTAAASQPQPQPQPQPQQQPSPLILTLALERELSMPMRAHVEKHADKVARLVRAICVTIPDGSGKNSAEQLSKPSVVRLVQLGARMAYRSVVLNKIKAMGVDASMLGSDASANASPPDVGDQEPRSSFRQLSRDGEPGASFRAGTSFKKAKASERKRSSLCGVDNSIMRGSAALAVRDGSFVDADDEGYEALLAEFSAAYATEKAFLRGCKPGRSTTTTSGSDRSATAEVLPCLNLVLRACVDAFFFSFYKRTMAALCVALDPDRARRAACDETGSESDSRGADCGGEQDADSAAQAARDRAVEEEVAMCHEFHVLRQEVDALLSSVTDPGAFLRRSRLLTPPSSRHGQVCSNAAKVLSKPTIAAAHDNNFCTISVINKTRELGTLQQGAGMHFLL